MGTMDRTPIGLWYGQHDPFFAEPMRALAAGYTIEEIREEYSRVFVEKYAKQIFQKDLRTLAVRAFHN